jgi:UDP-N-acetylmuramoylalanine--D-glutamate ligase
MKAVNKSPENLAGKKVTVVGLGRFGGGVGVTRWLTGQGAKVTVSDQANADSLADSVNALAGLDVTLHLGGHHLSDFTDTDLLVINPAVPKNNPNIQAGLSAGIAWTTEINLFIQRCPGRLVGITGSVGKSTTTAMIGEILRRHFRTFVGGNIGKSLLDDLPQIGQDAVVVLELSSFQLEDLPQIGISPSIAVVTNLTPNHLDRHGTMESYAAAKKNIFKFQSPADCLILNSACAITSAWAKDAVGRVEYFDGRIDSDDSKNADAASPAARGAEAFKLCLPGAHNQANAQAAWTAVRQLGVDRASAQAVLADFAGLPHRLAFVCQSAGGVKYYNDSKCTTPEGCMVAVRSFLPRQAVVIVGGYDKHVSFDAMGQVLADRAKAVVAIGATKSQITAAIGAHRQDSLPKVELADDFPSAVRAAAKLAGSGDAVLLSPACASYDMFDNYEQRGDLFVELVKKL